MPIASSLFGKRPKSPQDISRLVPPEAFRAANTRDDLLKHYTEKEIAYSLKFYESEAKAKALEAEGTFVRGPGYDPGGEFELGDIGRSLSNLPASAMNEAMNLSKLPQFLGSLASSPIETGKALVGSIPTTERELHDLLVNNPFGALSMLPVGSGALGLGAKGAKAANLPKIATGLESVSKATSAATIGGGVKSGIGGAAMGLDKLGGMLAPIPRRLAPWAANLATGVDADVFRVGMAETIKSPLGYQAFEALRKSKVPRKVRKTNPAYMEELNSALEDMNDLENSGGPMYLAAEEKYRAVLSDAGTSKPWIPDDFGLHPGEKLGDIHIADIIQKSIKENREKTGFLVTRAAQGLDNVELGSEYTLQRIQDALKEVGEKHDLEVSLVTDVDGEFVLNSKVTRGQNMPTKITKGEYEEILPLPAPRYVDSGEIQNILNKELHSLWPSEADFSKGVTALSLHDVITSFRASARNKDLNVRNTNFYKDLADELDTYLGEMLPDDHSYRTTMHAVKKELDDLDNIEAYLGSGTRDPVTFVESMESAFAGNNQAKVDVLSTLSEKSDIPINALLAGRPLRKLAATGILARAFQAGTIGGGAFGASSGSLSVLGAGLTFGAGLAFFTPRSVGRILSLMGASTRHSVGFVNYLKALKRWPGIEKHIKPGVNVATVVNHLIAEGNERVEQGEDRWTPQELEVIESLEKSTKSTSADIEDSDSLSVSVPNFLRPGKNLEGRLKNQLLPKGEKHPDSPLSPKLEAMLSPEAIKRLRESFKSMDAQSLQYELHGFTHPDSINKSTTIEGRP